MESAVLAIRQADSGDLELVGRLAAAIWPGVYHPIIGEQQVAYMLERFYSPSALKQQFDAGHRFFIAETHSPVGFASMSPEGEERWKLQKLYLLAALHGTGAGKGLLKHLIDLLTSEGQQNLFLNVNRYNARAIAFYEKMGFNQIAVEDIDIGNGFWMNDYVYSLDIKQQD